MSKMPKQSPDQNSGGERKISFSIQQIVTYSITILTIGASIYTFVKALPKIEALDASLQQLRESNARVDQRISDLKEFISLQKQVEPAKVLK